MHGESNRQVSTMKTTSGILCTMLFLMAALGVAAHASQIAYLSPKEMAERADLVVLGKVARVHSFWNENHTKIFTRTTIAVDETYKGTASPTVDILQLGGTVDYVRVTVDGALSWTEGEEVLLFLEPYVPGARQVSGFSQGKFDIERDPESGEAYITRPPLEGVKALQVPASAAAPAAGGAIKVPLERFIRETLGTD